MIRVSTWLRAGGQLQVYEVGGGVVIDAGVALEDHRVLSSVEGQQCSAELLGQVDSRLIRRRRIVGRRNDQHRGAALAL